MRGTLLRMTITAMITAATVTIGGVEAQEGVEVGVVELLEQRLAALEATCRSSNAAESHENDIAARLDAQERALGRAGTRHRAQVEQLELGISQQEQRLNDTDATLQGLLALPSGLADARVDLARVSAQLEEMVSVRTAELGRVEAATVAAASAAEAAFTRMAAIESTQSAQAAAVEALVQKVAALEQSNPAVGVDALAGQVEQLAIVQAQTAADIEALRHRLESISADVDANARAAAVTAEGKAKEIEHRVVFVPADTQEPQLKQHQRVRAT